MGLLPSGTRERLSFDSQVSNAPTTTVASVSPKEEPALVSPTYVASRNAVHGIAEYVLAGPQFEESETIRLRVTPDGFATRMRPNLRVEGTELVAVHPQLYTVLRIPMVGHTYASLASAAGVKARDLRDVYADAPAVGIDDEIVGDLRDVRLIFDAWRAGHSALKKLAPLNKRVLWPEHLDITSRIDEHVYGVSAGDAYHDGPYAYIHTDKVPDKGKFWNAPFGAMMALGDHPDKTKVLAFFKKGKSRL